jgi:hypothetical protein
MDADGERLEQDAIVDGKPVSEGEAQVRWMREESACRAFDGWRTVEAHVRAEVRIATLAPFAVTARDSRFDGDTRADSRLCDSRTVRDDGAGGFVSERKRVRDDAIADAPVLIVVDIRPADTNRACADKDLTSGRCWLFGLDNAKRVWCNELCGIHERSRAENVCFL